MRSSLARDLGRWERGVLSGADLELRHPGRAAGMLAMYERLSDLGRAPVPDPEAGWERLQERLPEHRVAVPVRTMGRAFGLRRLVARPLALAAALVLLGAAVGYAAAPEAVNRRLASVWERVEDLFRDEATEGRPGRSPAGERSGVGPSDSDDEDGGEGHGRSGDDGDGDDGKDREVGDDREAGDDDDREGSPEGGGEGSDAPGEGSDDSGEGSDDGSGEGEEPGESHEAQEPDTPDD